ncbi:MAG: thioredoxin-dependent thiol peroxidase [Gemmatimonadaceae bacterium]|nr:thioredoxin-dependent thiol peroxidase [Gemmatimonadaceae bacterium]
MPLAAGRLAPDFTLATDTGESRTLSALRGKRVVLYFYPKDDTSGCTQQACEFAEHMPRFKRGKAVLLGISPDSVKSHVKFKKKYDLSFPLLADTEHAVAEVYDVWKEKLFWGRRYMGVERTTYIIAPDGTIEHVFERVVPAGHAAEVWTYLRGAAKG